MAHNPRDRKIPARSIGPNEPEGWDKDPDRPLGVQLLAVHGTQSFLTLGISSVLPMLQRTEPAGQRGKP